MKASENLYQAPWNFLALPDSLSSPGRSRAWVMSVPYDGTVCYGAGARNGPAAIIAASRQIEKYDRDFRCVPAATFGIHTLPPLAIAHGSPATMEGRIARAVSGVLSGPEAPALLAVLGGEHSISPGVVRGLLQARPKRHTKLDLVTVHIDAHADLALEYDGTPYSHACAAQRILDVSPLFQIGIRSLSEAEDKLIRRNRRIQTVFAEDAKPGGAWLKKLARFVKGRDVFLTIDADGLDPSIMPAVGTPEPGGLSWETTLDVVRTVCRHARSLPAFDLVELSPIPGMIAPDFLCARLVYKIMCAALMR